LQCESIVEDYEDEILHHFKNANENGITKICSDIAGITLRDCVLYLYLRDASKVLQTLSTTLCATNRFYFTFA